MQLLCNVSTLYLKSDTVHHTPNYGIQTLQDICNDLSVGKIVHKGIAHKLFHNILLSLECGSVNSLYKLIVHSYRKTLNILGLKE